MRNPARMKWLTLLPAAAALAISALFGIGLYTTRSELQPGGEVGWYFICTYLGAGGAFSVNYSHAPDAQPGVATFWEARTDCPTFAYQSDATVGWRR